MTVDGLFCRQAIDDLLIGAEPLDTFVRDGFQLFVACLQAAGKPASSVFKMNFELMKTLERAGMFRLIVARFARKPVGFLLTVLSPSFEDRDVIEGTHAMTYCVPGHVGLGLRLQRASIEWMKSAGVTEVHFRAGTRGDGPRMDKLYSRLGATPNGEDWKLMLVEKS